MDIKQRLIRPATPKDNGKVERSHRKDQERFYYKKIFFSLEEKVFGKLGELKNLKKQNNMIICFGGCMSQEKHIIEKIKTSYPLVDIIFGTHNFYKFPEMLYKKINENKKMVDVWNIDGEIIEGLPIKRMDDKTALVTIMNGCNNFCSYCIVPYTRGRERSRKPEDSFRACMVPKRRDNLVDVLHIII